MMTWDDAMDAGFPLWGALAVSLAVVGLRALWLLHAARRARRVRQRRQAGRIIGQTGPGTLRWGGVIQRHPMECADCHTRSNGEGLCVTCGGRRWQARGIHRESAA